MFQSLSRSYNELSNDVTLTINDSCFTYFMTDTCQCRYENCPETLSNLIRIYERKSLNVSKNVTSYLMWLAKLGWYAYDELTEQGYVAETHPELQFRKKYNKSIREYLRNGMLTSVMAKPSTYKKNGWSI